MDLLWLPLPDMVWFWVHKEDIHFFSIFWSWIEMLHGLSMDWAQLDRGLIPHRSSLFERGSYGLVKDWPTFTNSSITAKKFQLWPAMWDDDKSRRYQGHHQFAGPPLGCPSGTKFWRSTSCFLPKLTLSLNSSKNIFWIFPKILKKNWSYLGQGLTLVQSRSLNAKILFWRDTLPTMHSLQKIHFCPMKAI